MYNGIIKRVQCHILGLDIDGIYNGYFTCCIAITALI